MTGEFPAQIASNAENISIWWRHPDKAGTVCIMSGMCLERHIFGNDGFPHPEESHSWGRRLEVDSICAHIVVLSLSIPFAV